jgi:hypothetical protein
MVALSTRKEFEARARAAVDVTARLLGEWTQRQVQQISVNEKTPYIWPLSPSSFIIGNYRVVGKNGYWTVLNTYYEVLHQFDSKLSAVFYCLCEQKGRLKLAQSIRALDSEVKRLKNDIVHFESSVNRAIANKKGDSVAIWDARLYDARLQLQAASLQLQKSLTSAKYIKYWE